MNFLLLIVPLLATALVIRFLISHQLAGKLQDVPNDRSLHSIPVPRIGGVGVLGGVFAGWAATQSGMDWWMIAPTLGLFAVSLLDDLHSLPVRIRLPAHLLAALMLVAGMGTVGINGMLIALLAVLGVVWVTNLFNFMDGSDGLAGGMALFGFTSYGAAALLAGQHEFALLSFSIAAAALAFLWFNFNPAKIFLGDAGSIPLGFLVAALGLSGWQMGCWEAWFPVMVFSPFIVDATVTLFKRTARGVKITEAHREHYYQRLVQMGWSHRKLALVEYGLMLAVSLSALFMLQYSWPIILLGGWLLLYAALMLWIDRRWDQSQQAKSGQAKNV